ncbi:mCpol domain-containing protein [Streptomyces polygonati]|uniref:MCpol domain-containing protein n=1 Tax=Streptomyces polygonati TaxID=1617087 RepID=A0ABV8HSG8_9ACTN
MPYAIIDGDDVGVKIEAHILANDVESFKKTSALITQSIESLVSELEITPGIDVISHGGDSILARVESSQTATISEILSAKQKPGQFTFSVGIGEDLRQSFIALRMAKSSGKRKVVVY